MAARFLLMPGPVRSQTDGDQHWVGAGQLARLYELQPHEYFVCHPGQGYTGFPDGLKMLFPRRDGKYGRPT